MKASLMVKALIPESLFPALLYTANDLQQNHFPLIQVHALHEHLFAVRGSQTAESPLARSQETALPSETLWVG